MSHCFYIPTGTRGLAILALGCGILLTGCREQGATEQAAEALYRAEPSHPANTTAVPMPAPEPEPATAADLNALLTQSLLGTLFRVGLASSQGKSRLPMPVLAGPSPSGPARNHTAFAEPPHSNPSAKRLRMVIVRRWTHQRASASLQTTLSQREIHLFPDGLSVCRFLVTATASDPVVIRQWLKAADTLGRELAARDGLAVQIAVIQVAERHAIVETTVAAATPELLTAVIEIAFPEWEVAVSVKFDQREWDVSFARTNDTPSGPWPADGRAGDPRFVQMLVGDATVLAANADFWNGFLGILTWQADTIAAQGLRLRVRQEP